ncbi:MAG: hypothetical protein MUF58_21280 [Arcicella sp.]|jgi:hypothetical protein|nr:hypothetical protein [Arcicella sp.]
MQKIIPFGFTIIFCLIHYFSIGQDNFNSCSAIFLNNRMLVNDYSPTGKCSVSITTKGDLSVSTVELSPKETKAILPILFQIAIRDKQTGTVTLVSKTQIKKIAIQKVLQKCKKGDHVLVLTTDKQYALPHNEILVF